MMAEEERCPHLWAYMPRLYYLDPYISREEKLEKSYRCQLKKGHASLHVYEDEANYFRWRDDYPDRRTWASWREKLDI
jgi:hypothetical protein